MIRPIASLSFRFPNRQSLFPTSHTAMTFPEDLYYTKEHEWLRLDADGKTATIGITHFAARELGDIVFVELNDEGTDVSADAVFGSVEAVKTVSELFAPVAGKIVEINGALDANPEFVNEDPYGKGWMVKLEVADASAIEGLMRASDYEAMVG